MAMEDEVVRHYGNAGIAERILAALRAVRGPEAPVTVDALAPLDHFHGGGVIATQALARVLNPQPGQRLIDIGSGIGGPARWMAAKFGVHVTGVDLTPEFCEAAEALTRAAGLEAHIRIVNGSALELPAPDGAFDAAYSQNVVMNIADKQRFYREAFRVLRPGGLLAVASVCAGSGGEPYYPQMWAATVATSFLTTPEDTSRDMRAGGFAIVSFRDTSADQPSARTRSGQQLEPGRLPPLGIHVLMGEETVREAQRNGARSLAEGRTAAIEALLRKPG
jgi:ubiquinone/menaquinone biosynthesis C-methylase UbiE